MGANVVAESDSSMLAKNAAATYLTRFSTTHPTEQCMLFQACICLQCGASTFLVVMQTTTINCLTGVIPASGGDALVYGEALSSTGGMDRIRSMMGVCPQFDVLWNELTGLEHLTIYGNIKVPLTLSKLR